MFDRPQFDENQKVDIDDFRNIANLPKASADRYSLDFIGDGGWYTGFKCIDKGNGQLNVGNGNFYLNGVGYYNNTVGGEAQDLLAVAPAVSFRWVAIIVRGQEMDSDTEETTVLVDSTTRATTGKYKPRTITRSAIVDKVLGNISADPQMPLASQVPPGNIIVAFVKVSPAGIVAIVPNVVAMLPNLKEARTRLDENDVWRVNTGSQIDALGTSIAAIQGRLSGLPQGSFVMEVARDVANLKTLLKVPQVYTDYGDDHYLNLDYSDYTNPDYLAEVMEGIRFPPAAESDSQIGLLNPYDDSVSIVGGILFPKFTPVTSLSNTDHDNTVVANQYQYQTTEVKQLSMTVQRLRYGDWFFTCTNQFWYLNMGGGTYDSTNLLFRLYNGQVLQIDPAYAGAAAGVYSSDTAGDNTVRVRWVWQDSVQEPYTSVETVTKTFNGAQCGNTFLCPRDGWMPALNLYFSDKAAAGDVTVAIIKCPASGQPDYSQIIATTTIAVGDIKISTAAAKVPTPAQFSPLVMMQKGQRYAFAVITAGAHTLWRSTGNKLGQGSFFVNTDGAWNIADPINDLCFDLVFAQFSAAQLAVQFNQLTLNGGICAIDILAQMFTPPGTTVSWEIQLNGQWQNLMTVVGDQSWLTGLPPLLPFRAFVSGTTELMPGIGVLSNSRVACTRPRSDFKHLSDKKQLPPGTTANTVNVTTRLEWWRGALHHAHAVKLRYGANFASLKTASLVKEIPAPDDPDNAIIRTYTFSFPAPINALQIEQDGTTDNVVRCYHVAGVDWVAFTQ